MKMEIGDRCEVITVTDNSKHYYLYNIGSTGIITRVYGNNQIVALCGINQTLDLKYFKGWIIESGCYKHIGQLKVTHIKSPSQRKEFRKKYNIK